MIYIYTKGTIYLRPQIAKANRGGRSYTQSVVKPVIIKLQQYKNKTDLVAMLDKEEVYSSSRRLLISVFVVMHCVAVFVLG